MPHVTGSRFNAARPIEVSSAIIQRESILLTDAPDSADGHSHIVSFSFFFSLKKRDKQIAVSPVG